MIAQNATGDSSWARALLWLDPWENADSSIKAPGKVALLKRAYVIFTPHILRLSSEYYTYRIDTSPRFLRP